MNLISFATVTYYNHICLEAYKDTSLRAAGELLKIFKKSNWGAIELSWLCTENTSSGEDTKFSS